ncbi:MAG: hypothetical protein WBA22_08680 [Candidatus Methanofastidiosia archaeon]
MIQIVLPEEPIFRGESLKGSLHISSLSPDRAREIKAVILWREWYVNKLGMIFTTQHEELLVLEQDIEITPTGIHHTINYSIPEDAPFTFEDRPIKIQWGVKVSVKKSRFFRESAFQKFIVLPHVLKSESPPLIDRVPIPTPEHGFISDLSIGATQLWRSLRPLSKSEGLRIQLEKSVYFPGDTVTGSIFFSKGFKDAVLSIYLTFMAKLETLPRSGEKEHLMVRIPNTFQAGSEVPFSFTLSPLMCPEFETEKWKISWKIKAIVTRRFHIGKCAESHVRIKPLEF